MSQQHPITPPLGLINQWWGEAKQNAKYDEPIGPLVAAKAAQWGADKELEACLLLVGDGRRENLSQVISLRAARRPKPPSLKEQALAKLPEHPESMASYLSLSPGSVATIRRALEALDD